VTGQHVDRRGLVVQDHRRAVQAGGLWTVRVRIGTLWTEQGGVVMEPLAIIPLVLIVLAIVAVVAVRRQVPVPPEDPDPLFIVGIIVSGTGAALTAALGAHMVLMALFGVLLIAVGARRSRKGTHRRR
jgi:hypothetical protein